MVERTLPKPDTRVRFPSAAPKAPDFVAGLFPRLKRESLPGGNTFPRALGISAFQPVSRSTSLLPHGRRLFILGWMWWLGSVGRVEAVCSLLLQGTRPRFASDTLMSRRNIPASPLPLFPSLWCEVGMRTAGHSAWEECARRGGGEYSGWVPQTAYRGRQIGIWVPRWFRRDVEAPTRRLAAKGLIATMRAHGSAIPS